MGIYIYKAKKGPVEVVSGDIEAPSQEEAVNILERRGLMPISVAEKEAGKPEPVSRLAGEPVSQLDRQTGKLVNRLTISVRRQDVDTFTRQLASLLKAGVPMLRSLTLISEQTENRVFARVVEDLEKRIRDGEMFSEVLARYPRLFDSLYLNMIKSGEKSGSLDEVLYKLTEHRQKEEEVRRKIQAAMAYPALVLIVGIITVFVMLTYFLPKLSGLFENMKFELPLPTKILIGVSSFMSNNWYWFLIAAFCFFAVFSKVKPGSKKKFLFDIVKLYIPFIRTFVMNAEVARFSRTLGMLIKNGISIYEALRLATNTLNNEALRDRLRITEESIINQGATLSSGIKKAQVFPKFVLNMITVGEEGGKLEGSLDEIANAYEREVDQSIKIMTSLIEPLLMLAVGAVVGFIVFAMLLPIFNIGI
ncbi:MAG: type II secretion system F family protein [Candidatus Omnitrophica bacterium]|nr:type II secretion system F family protein [Candidatus Omnitrophota bacterium]